MKLFTYYYIYSYLFMVGLGYNILILFPHEGKSHLRVYAPLVRELVSRGHNLTTIVHHSFGTENENYKEIILKNSINMSENVIGLEAFDIPLRIQCFMVAMMLTNAGKDSCSDMLSNPEVQNLIISDRKFDLIITELFNSECYVGFVDKFKAPLIGLSSCAMMPWYPDRFGQSDNPAYIPSIQHWFGKYLDFADRVENFLGVIWYKAAYWYASWDFDDMTEKSFKKKSIPFSEIRNNISLLLANTHFSLNFARPHVPAIVEIGGIHLQEPRTLPVNIEKFINESTHGVIYFSLGSMIKGHTFPQDKREEFLRAFARLPQRVLWKWENETMPGKPDNVMIQKWMPQFDILSHPNVKAFISHGGLLGTTEAVHCGVPMLVMPQYGDQHTNAKAIEANGGGVILYLKEATEEKVYQSLKTLLSPEFRVKAKALSERFRDRPMSPMDTAIYWVEYVARHKGAPHLRTAAVDMPLYQYLLLDVIAFLAIILIIFAYITYKMISLILRALFSKKKVKQS